MEVVVFVAMLVVPVISIAAFLMVLVLNKKVAALKKLVLELTVKQAGGAASPVAEFMVGEI